MNHFTFNFTFGFLFSCHWSIQYMSKISWILLMFHYYNVTASQTLIMSNISYWLCNILNTFASNSKKNISIFKILWTWYILFFSMRNTFIKPCIICSIYFSISYTRYSFFGNLITFNSSTSINRSWNIF